MNGRADYCGVILAGGKSARMGRDKALIEIHGIPMIRRLAEMLLVFTDRVIVSANNRSAYDFLGLPVVADIFPGRGPLAGLHAAMVHSSLPTFLLVACDMPRIPPSLLHRLVDLSNGYDAVVPLTSRGQAQPMCALYHRTCFAVIERRLKGRLNRFTAFVEDRSLRVRWLPPGEGCFTDDDMCNLNYPKDLYDFQRSNPDRSKV